GVVGGDALDMVLAKWGMGTPPLAAAGQAADPPVVVPAADPVDMTVGPPAPAALVAASVMLPSDVPASPAPDATPQESLLLLTKAVGESDSVGSGSPAVLVDLLAELDALLPLSL
ncbi:unnamed protein product, partial [marine sediment metagenome]